MPDRPTAARSRLLFALLVAFVIAVFARTLDFGLYLDDNHHARPWTVGEVLGTFAGPFDPLGIEPPYFRPLLVVTFALDWALWGFDAWGYHLTNVLLHALGSAMVLLMLQAMRLPNLVALAGAAYFALIPANAATAIYISERSDAMVTVLTLGALVTAKRYISAGRIHQLAAVNVLALGAMCSKEAGVAVVPLLGLFVLHEAVAIHLARTATDGTGPAVSGLRQLQRAAEAAARDPLLRRRMVWLVSVPLLLLVAYATYRAAVLPTGLLGARYGASGPIRGLASAVVWTFRAVPWEVPAPLSLPLLGAVVLLALATRPRAPTLAFMLAGASWVVLACLPLAPLGQVEPRLLYLPEVGHALLVAGALTAFVQSWNRRDTEGRRTPTVLGLAVLGVLCLSMVRNHWYAQEQFQPLGYKMLTGYRRVVDDPKKNLYPRENLDNIERILNYAREHDLDGAR